VINKKIASSAYKSQIRLRAKDIEESKLIEKGKKSGKQDESMSLK
jgi:hypothetical protein